MYGLRQRRSLQGQMSANFTISLRVEYVHQFIVRFEWLIGIYLYNIVKLYQNKSLSILIYKPRSKTISASACAAIAPATVWRITMVPCINDSTHNLSVDEWAWRVQGTSVQYDDGSNLVLGLCWHRTLAFERPWAKWTPQLTGVVMHIGA